MNTTAGREEEESARTFLKAFHTRHIPLRDIAVEHRSPFKHYKKQRTEQRSRRLTIRKKFKVKAHSLIDNRRRREKERESGTYFVSWW